MATEIQTGYAPVNGTQLYFEVAGQGDALVLLHGSTLDTRMWDDQFAEFSRDRMVVRYDKRGHGRSPEPDGQPFNRADDLVGLLDHLGIARADLLGLSLGGVTALSVAVEHPGRVRSLILASSGIPGYQPDSERMTGLLDDYRASVAPIYRKAADDGVDAARSEWLDHQYFDTTRARPDVRSRLEAIIGDYSGWHWYGPRAEFEHDPPAAARLTEITAPALVISGERDHPVIVAAAEVLAAQIPNVRHHVIPGAGHMCNMEEPGIFNRLVSEFLDEVSCRMSG